MASKTSRVVLERVACVATFTRAGVKQFDRDRVAHADAFAECASSSRARRRSSQDQGARRLRQRAFVRDLDGARSHRCITERRNEGIISSQRAQDDARNHDAGRASLGRFCPADVVAASANASQ